MLETYTDAWPIKAPFPQSINTTILALHTRIDTLKGEPKPPTTQRDIDEVLYPNPWHFTAKPQTGQQVWMSQTNKRKLDLYKLMWELEETECRDTQIYIYDAFRNPRAIIELFSKREKTNTKRDKRVEVMEGVTESLADPRAVMPSKAYHRYLSMKYLGKPQEHSIIEEIEGIFGYPMIAKGRNPKEIGRAALDSWRAVGGTVGALRGANEAVIVLLDCVRFDGSVGDEVAKWVFGMLEEMYPGDQTLHDLLYSTLRPQLRFSASDGSVKYNSKRHNLSSGLTWTSLFAILVVCKVYHNTYGSNLMIRLLDMGDDFALIMNKSQLGIVNRILLNFKRIGINVLEEGRFDIFEQTRFCQMFPVMVGDSYEFFRAPAGWVKDLIKLKSDHELSRQDYAYSVALGGLAWVAQDGKVLPIAYAHYQYILSVSQLFKKKPKLKPWALEGGLGYQTKHLTLQEKSERVFLRPGDVADDTRESFAAGTGIKPCSQVAIEEELIQMTLANIAKKTATCSSDVVDAPWGSIANNPKSEGIRANHHDG